MPDVKNIDVVKVGTHVDKKTRPHLLGQKNVPKSSQELATQVQKVHDPLIRYTEIPNKDELNARYFQMRNQVVGFLEAGVDEQFLSNALNSLYQEGFNSGIYSPLKGDSSEEFLQAETQKYKNYGYSSEDDAQDKAIKSLAAAGFVSGLRSSRRVEQRDIREQFDKFFDQYPISSETEIKRIAELREKCISIDASEPSDDLNRNFPGGNFLFHATRVREGIKILESGELANAKTLLEREQEKVQQGKESDIVKNNTGHEGISWSFNRIDALPGDRYHLIGFLTSPNVVLDPNLQLAIPSRPAPNELILLNRDINAGRYYGIKTQQELLESLAILGESNSVFSNLLDLSILRKEQSEGELSGYAHSLLEDYSQNGFPKEKVEQQLRSLYTMRDDGTVEFAPSLLEQGKNKVPLAAVWFQALLDSGRIRSIQGFDDVSTVQQVIEKITDDNVKDFFPELKKDKDYLELHAEKETSKVTSVTIPTNQMYFVVPDMDLEKWLKVLARCNSVPEGIIVYNRSRVRLENFASLHKGDHAILTQELKRLIPPRSGYIDYEHQILGTELTPDKLAGSRSHVIGEEHLEQRKCLVKDERGEVIAA